MATGIDDERQKAYKRRLQKLLREANNASCIDCSLPNPTWASKNLGVFVCMNCAGIHRSMGTHISQVRSVTLDQWEENWVKTMEAVGNRKANSYWEAQLPSSRKITPGTDSRRREEFIREKWEHKQFYSDIPSLSTTPEPERELSREERRELRRAAAKRQTSAPLVSTPTNTPIIPTTSTSVPTTRYPNISTPASSTPVRTTTVPVTTPTQSAGGRPSQPSIGLYGAGDSRSKTTPLTNGTSSASHRSSPWVSKTEHSASPWVPNLPAPVTTTPTPIPVPTAGPSSTSTDDIFAGLSMGPPTKVSSITRSTTAPAGTLTLGTPEPVTTLPTTKESDLLDFSIDEEVIPVTHSEAKLVEPLSPSTQTFDPVITGEIRKHPTPQEIAAGSHHFHHSQSAPVLNLFFSSQQQHPHHQQQQHPHHHQHHQHQQHQQSYPLSTPFPSDLPTNGFHGPSDPFFSGSSDSSVGGQEEGGFGFVNIPPPTSNGYSHPKPQTSLSQLPDLSFPEQSQTDTDSSLDPFHGLEITPSSKPQVETTTAKPTISTTTCQVSGCTREAVSRGLCASHIKGHTNTNDNSLFDNPLQNFGIIPTTATQVSDTNFSAFPSVKDDPFGSEFGFLNSQESSIPSSTADNSSFSFLSDNNFTTSSSSTGSQSDLWGYNQSAMTGGGDDSGGFSFIGM